MSIWRQGRRVPRNIYRGDEPICMVADEEIAAEMVQGLNQSPRMIALIEAEERIAALEGELAYTVKRRQVWQKEACDQNARAEKAEAELAKLKSEKG